MEHGRSAHLVRTPFHAAIWARSATCQPSAVAGVIALAGNVAALRFVSNGKEVVMIVALAIAFIVLIGPLAVLYGVDSRVDDRRGGWPDQRR